MGGDEHTLRLPPSPGRRPTSRSGPAGPLNQAPHGDTDLAPQADNVCVFAVCPDPLSRHRGGAGGQEGKTSALQMAPGPIPRCHGHRNQNDECGPLPPPGGDPRRLSPPGAPGSPNRNLRDWEPGPPCVSEPSRRRSRARTSEDSVNSAQKTQLSPGTSGPTPRVFDGVWASANHLGRVTRQTHVAGPGRPQKSGV